MELSLVQAIQQKYSYSQKQIEVVLKLLEEKNTVPFIARYRKEMTGGLDEVEIKTIYDEYHYMENLQKRKDEVIQNIAQQGLLTEDLKKDILKQTKLQRVEDLYRPFKQKKKTRATEAKRKGLEPLATWIYQQEPSEPLQQKAEQYINDEISTVEEAIQGAQDIIAEIIADNPNYRKKVLIDTAKSGLIITQKRKKAEDEKQVYQMYYDYQEPIKRIANHRILAMNRGEKEKVISVKLDADRDHLIAPMIKKEVKGTHELSQIVKSAIEDAMKRLIFPSIEREIRNDLTDKAETQAITIFSENLKSLLLQPPLKDKKVLGVDPAYRTGCKLAVMNEMGSFITKSVIYPHPPQSKKADAERIFVEIVKRYDIQLIAIGNGTASRETEQFVANMIKKHQLEAQYIIVNEAGASVYSASEIARDEFPDFQVEERSAVSIGRRVQDPLSELVKIDPKSIGVGQYQHDVNQKSLSHALDFVVETAVNQVGVNVNTASSTLLQHVSGLTKQIADNIVKHREELGMFKHHSEIKKVKRLGAKTFEQSIGFMRIIDGDEPLDNTAIHPESYEATYKLLHMLEIQIDTLGTQASNDKLGAVTKEKYATLLEIGVPTLEDIIKALMSPNRDPRDEYQTPELKSDVLSIEDLTKGMKLNGTVRNVVDFGAFVDIGVKQDGLVHISKLAKQFVKHPLDIVSVGDIVEVWIYDIDEQKEKVALTMIPPNE
ncbi:RNA-binding transcriptional accessory protein [Staphylococcus felis]|uniref:Tex family protein n=1 Tax=Staphylococcus felis TaxID=46127 RepID=UPI000E276719|nr:Tex family protein [Staphylococcus felis]REH96680.1 RNA-binding transcriptional accessory protein [Staphylococcus felis]REI03945.1 RNA-binding transcriptional accessory protein [Staphylococcus felis]REI20882.1 RNA-binding transcriptional accessory protein [Staphylococcus felis]REI33230.1 RNA-binding transcriptional accessory protein [Staphylococcus felis]